MQENIGQNWAAIALVLIVIGFLVGFILIQLFKKAPKQKHKDYQGYPISDKEYKKTLEAIDKEVDDKLAYQDNFVKENTIEASSLPTTDILKDTIDKVEDKSKKIKISDIVSSLLQQKINKSQYTLFLKPKDLANKISNLPKFKNYGEEVAFWAWVEEQIAAMTDEEREELQQFINSKKK